MTSSDIRKKFLDFFESKLHKVVDSAPIVLKDDPTLMFTNAGMNQFKDYFLGHKLATHQRVADTQKCLRVSGKHNDLEEVGVDTYHHTMFEMLGNWSFGDYFKKESIQWAWELLTEVYQLDTSRLYITVFEGDDQDGLAEDQEALEIWKELVDESKILKASKKDNFWEMGDTGPCGPCSEIHYDMRSQSEIDELGGRSLVNMDHEQVIEIWNLVFIQYNRKADGSLESLPDQHIDTGMGFERLVRAIQGKQSNYDSDVFMPLINKVTELTDNEYRKNHQKDVAIRVISDHVRAIAFSIGDGQLPSNTGAGYVIRRILRRAVRYAYTFLDQQDPFIFQLVDVLCAQFGDVFPELPAQQDFIKKVIEEEEISFLRTLNSGIKRLDAVLAEEKKQIDGDVVFELYDTYGFPVDLTALIASEKGVKIDEKGFQLSMQKQKNRSKKDAVSEKGDWIEVSKADNYHFTGYDCYDCGTEIVKYREVSEKKKTYYQIVLNNTPFYAEGGGQVGDKGRIYSDVEEVLVFDTKKENDMTIHYCNKLPQVLTADFTAEVRQDLRQATTLNHSATHLLQAALQEVLGTHIAQKGSLVNPNLLRFDFTHFSKVTKDELARVEDLVNQKIQAGIALDEKRDYPFAEAKELGAMALFGEKYGEKVRVITFDQDFSVELCGGTHVKNTSEISLFKIQSESSVAAGVRRVEAITGANALAYYKDQEALLSELKEVLKQPKDVVKSINDLVQERNELLKKIEFFEAEKGQELKKYLESKVIFKNGFNYVIEKVNAPNTDSIKQIAFEMRNHLDNLVFIIGAISDSKPSLSIMFSDNLTIEKNWNAGQMVRELAKEIQGGGGGQAFFATAGGKKSEGLESALAKARVLVQLED